VDALKGQAKMSVTLTQSKKTRMINKEISDMILCIGEKVLRKIAMEKTRTKI
jgi:hypothetical protein